jgi:ElaB/YqjD/DUF883 family membrane-anchored ribosome-binding protein
MSNHSNPSTETLKRDAKTLAEDAAKAAKNAVVPPVVDAAHRVGDYVRESASRVGEYAKDTASRASEYARDAASRASDYARGAYQDSRKQVSKQFANAEHYAQEGYDRTKSWISTNPLAAVGVALVAGLLLSTVFRSGNRR